MVPPHAALAPFHPVVRDWFAQTRAAVCPLCQPMVLNTP